MQSKLIDSTSRRLSKVFAKDKVVYQLKPKLKIFQNLRKVVWSGDIWQAFFLPSDLDTIAKNEKNLKAEFGSEIVNLKKKALKIIQDKATLKKYADLKNPMSSKNEEILLALMEAIHEVSTGNQAMAAKVAKYFREIADNFGMWKVRYALEDAVFNLENPQEYAYICSVIEKEKNAHLKLFDDIQNILEYKFSEEGIKDYEILFRKKNIFGIYQKMKIKGKNINHMTDFFAMRVIVDKVSDCYRVLDILHYLWPHYSAKLKDYIKNPRPNSYRSIHTTLICLDKKVVEFQVRTREMDMVAKYGPASHSGYKKKMRSLAKVR